MVIDHQKERFEEKVKVLCVRVVFYVCRVYVYGCVFMCICVFLCVRVCVRVRLHVCVPVSNHITVFI